MPCPYAERRGSVIYCKAAGKIVNPLSHPCLSKTRYTKCKYYRQAQEKQRPGSAPAQEQRPTPAAPLAPSEPGTPREGAPKTRGLTLDGRPARNCLECIYYGSRTGMCLLLGVEVKDPYDPPCAKS